MSNAPSSAPAAPGSYDPKLTSHEYAQMISALGIKKANTKLWQLWVLGVLAGVYISLGAHLYLVAIEQGMGRIVGGAVFSLGLVFIVVAGAELFTGNIIMIVGAITLLFPLRSILRNWVTVYLGNFAGALLCVLLVWHAGLLMSGGELNALGTLAANVTTAKLSLSFTEAFLRGVLCNMLVILAIIMATLSKDIISKIACCVFPIMAFVACGFEHCVANMYLIPLGLCAQNMPMLDYSFLVGNLLPVTLGNIVGGMFILIAHPNRLRQLGYLLERKRSVHTTPAP